MQNSLTLPQDLPCSGLCLLLLPLLISLHISFRFSLLFHHFLPQDLFKCSPLFLKISPPTSFTSLLRSQFRFYLSWKAFPNLLSRFGDPVLCSHSNPCYPIITLTSYWKCLFNVLSYLLGHVFCVCSS